MVAAAGHSHSNSLEARSLYLCGECKNAVIKEKPAILCDVCEVWYHIECHNTLSDDYSELVHSSIDWLCHNCDCDQPTEKSDDYPSHTPSLPHSLSSLSSLDLAAEPKHTSSPCKPKP